MNVVVDAGDGDTDKGLLGLFAIKPPEDLIPAAASPVPCDEEDGCPGDRSSAAATAPLGWPLSTLEIGGERGGGVSASTDK